LKKLQSTRGPCEDAEIDIAETDGRLVATAKTIVVIGATGHFGGRIFRRIVGEPNLKLVVTSRRTEKAEAFAADLRTWSLRTSCLPRWLSWFS
jgi:FlaA1/EpsC-like NDP-sugar epimerase